ncbi:uncharacterized protein LOC119773526 [Cyprinodon tularosa]|uniref:uncharacterized protein LOC119773526 n=1 Tax=Cyprinodon tularosa TaxID=77115 RepID=UPI0018E20C03|nr:uncharacterized protein LOC119773526 [Cyprinodon tularosa]
MAAVQNPHARGDHRLCGCGNKISGKDTHPVCGTCLGVDHARLALEIPGSCGHCKVFTVKSLRRRLARQVSISDRDPFLPTAAQGAAAEEDVDSAGEAPETDYDWGAQCEQLHAPPFPEEDVLEVSPMEEDDDTSFLISEDEEEDDTFMAPAQPERPKPPCPSAMEDRGASSQAPSLHVDLLDVCKRAAEKLEIPWPVAIAEPTRSRYEGKRLPLARNAVKQLLPVFPELLTELSKTWTSCPYSNRSPISGAASLDCEAMDAHGLLSMPPVEVPVAAHLCPGSAYKAAALSARALSALSILTAYQAELFGASAEEQDPDAWEEMAVIADLSLRIQRVAVQATGKVMATLVVQERARWLSLANLTDRERDDILDMPIVPEGIFGSALATMQQRCEAKKKDNEALKLCLPRKAPAPSPPVQRTKTATTARSAPSDEEGARSRLAGETCLHDRYAAAAHSRRELGPTGEEEKEGGLTAASSSVGAACCSPLRRPTVLACLCAPHATVAHPRAGLRGEGHRPGGLRGCAPSGMVAAQPPAALLPGRAPPSPRSRAERSTVPPVVPENHFSVPPQGGAGQEPQYVPPLSLRWESWRAAAAPPWVLRTISRGYRLQFATVPPRFSGVIHSHAQGESARVLREEILSLIDKRAVSVVSPEQSLSGFYSRYFLVPKRGGRGIRPILDLRALNKFLRKYKFRMLTHAALLRLVRPNDWFSSVDLKDAYFHIPIYPPHRQYLRFAFQGVCYEYRVLPFGLSLSPRVFIRCTEAAVAPLRRRGIRLATYLDDWLLLAQSEQEARVHTHIVTKHLMDLGFVINMEKSHPSPTQEICFLGLSLRSVPFTARLSEERVTVFRTCLSQFRLHRSVQFRLCLRLLGLMASAILVIRLGRLHMRDFQRWVASLQMDPVRHGARRITVTADCITALRCWRAPSFLTQGVPMGTVSSRKVVTTDASLSGWGGIHEGRSVRGRWSQALQRLHINFLELSAVFLSLRHFLPFLSGHHVLVRTDNTTTVAYINRQEGLRSRMLHNLARDLILWSSTHFLSLRATHVPGDLNTGADLLSRGAPVYGEWTLHPQVVEQIWARYGRAQIDLFASRENARCELFFSLSTLNAPLGVDALAHAWPHELLYAFPPLALIPPTLARVRAFNHRLILIAPHWPAQHWLAEIFQMLCAQPWELPLRRDLLSQGAGTVYHPHPERLQLWAWPVSGLI